MFTITRKFEFDAGHRIPNHTSLCRNLHGHRYVLEVYLSGTVIQAPNASDFGMLIDFGEFKDLIKHGFVDTWDHAFLVYQGDTQVKDFLLHTLDNHKTVVLNDVPTVENLAKIAYDHIKNLLSTHTTHILKLNKIRLYETPNCWAEYYE